MSDNPLLATPSAGYVDYGMDYGSDYGNDFGNEYTKSFLESNGLTDFTQMDGMNFGGTSNVLPQVSLDGYSWNNDLFTSSDPATSYSGPSSLYSGNNSFTNSNNNKNGGFFSSMGDSWSSMQGKDQFGTAAGIGMGLLQAWGAYEARKLEEDKLDFQMDAFNKNFGMQKTAYNDNIQSRNRTLASATGSDQYAHKKV